MRKLGLFLTSMLVLGATVASSASSAIAAEFEWLRACGPNYQAQPFDVRNVGEPPDYEVGQAGRFTFQTASPFEFYPSSYNGRGAICGPWARRIPIGQSPLNHGARTFVTRAVIIAPPGVWVEPTLNTETEEALVPNNSYVGQANVVSLLWPLGYLFDPLLLPIDVKLVTDDRRQAPLAEQLPGDGAEAETRMGCPRETDLGEYEDIVVCTKVELPTGLGANWNWSMRIYNPEDKTFTFVQTIGELFGPFNTYGSISTIRSFFQCELIGAVGGDRCGEDPKAVDPIGQNIHFNGYAAVDETCADHSDPYSRYVVLAFRDRIKGEKPAVATACAGWRVAE